MLGQDFHERKCDVLILSRHIGEIICIGDIVEIMIVDIRGDKVRVGINAPAEVPVHRKEICEAIKRQHGGESGTHLDVKG